MTTQNKLSPTQFKKDLTGHVFRHMVLSLKGTQTPAWAMESPEAFVLTQHSPDSRLARGDRLTIISDDGDTVWDSCIVKKAEGGHVYLSKPARIVELEPAVLWSDGFAEIVPVGTGYSVRTIKTAHTDSHIYQSVDAARAQYQRGLPSKVA